MASTASAASLRAPPKRRRWLLLALVVPAAGCSSDVTRFDFPAFGIADKSPPPTGALPTPPEPVRQAAPSYTPSASPSYTPSSSPSYTRSYSLSYSPSSPAPANEGWVQSPRGAGLGDAPAAYGSGAEPPPDARGLPQSKDAVHRGPERGGERPRMAATGETIEVQPGDTLHSIARRHGVSIGALIEVNGLGDGSSLKPGQRLLLPVGTTPRSSPPERAANPPTGWDGQHTLQAGESLYSVARQYRVELAELQRVNGISDPSKVRAGTPLSVPRGSEPAPQPTRPVETGSGAPPTPTRDNPAGEAKAVAVATRTDDPEAPVAAEVAGKFRWPARGRVIAPFGIRSDGTHNDGINIALPLGTEIHAAESGRVAYAGSELKGYGNLVLIRHDGGWVSAYAHADQLLVRREETVRRGQVIARAGKTGSVDQPQLHFELRHGAKPVDPLPHLER